MSEERAELISALIDDELDPEQRKQALAAVLAEPALRQRWRAYHLIGDALRAERQPAGDLRERVMAALEKEPELQADAPPADTAAAGRSRLRPVGGLALAASLAMVAVLGGRSFEMPPAVSPVAQSSSAAAPATPSAATAGEPASAPVTPVRTVEFAVADATSGGRVTRMRWSTTQPDVQQRLNAYLVDYSEYLGTDLRGMLPYARVVGYDGRQP